MASGMAIKTEAHKAITVAQELTLARAVYARARSSAARARLATLLLLNDDHEELIALLDGEPELDFRDEAILVDAFLARETAADNRRALAAAERALALAGSDIARAQILAQRGKCETRLGLRDRALETLKQAIALDPHCKDACKRIAAIDLAAGRSDSVLAMVDDLLAQGVGHARLFGARVLAHARAGDFAAAREAEGFDLLHRSQTLAPPSGWETIEAFNAALTQELLAHPDTRYDRYGSASAFTWRIENPGRANTPLFNALVAQINEALEVHIEAASQSAHPWAAFKPETAKLRIWCVITEGNGHETWHVHQFGWLSGVYYVAVPEQIATGDDRRGCLSFGLPEELLGDALAAAYGEHLVRPEAGMLLTFPSHVYHRTYPHEAEGKRICVAFDLRA